MSNFRTQYYNSLSRLSNVPPVVNEKSIIDNLLKEPALDVEKLRHYCAHYTLPAIHRIQVWKILLDILPPHKGSHELSVEVRKEQYDDLFHCVGVTMKVTDETPKPHAWYYMFLIQERLMPLNPEGVLSNPESEVFCAIAQSVCRLCDDVTDQFWLTSMLYKHFLKNRCHFLLQMEKISSSLKVQDNQLWTALDQMGTLSAIPWEDWFKKGFAGVLPKTSFEKIWDRLLGGNFAILLNVALVMLSVFRRPLLSCTVSEKAITLLGEIPEDCVDSIVNKALDMCREPLKTVPD